MTPWSASSPCGTWAFERLEDSRTTWLVIYRVTGAVVGSANSLKGCRRLVAQGADAVLRRAETISRIAGRAA